MAKWLIVDTHLMSGLTDDVANEVEADTKEEAARKFGCQGTLSFRRMSDNTEWLTHNTKEDGTGDSVGLICKLG